MTHLPGSIDVQVPEPPSTPRKPVIDLVHGTEIIDPYRWLEEGTSPEVQAWTSLQNQRTEYVLKQLPQREFLRKRIGELMSKDTVGSPNLKGKRLFYTKRTEGKNQPVLMYIDMDRLGTSFSFEEDVYKRQLLYVFLGILAGEVVLVRILFFDFVMTSMLELLG